MKDPREPDNEAGVRHAFALCQALRMRLGIPWIVRRQHSGHVRLLAAGRSRLVHVLREERACLHRRSNLVSRRYRGLAGVLGVALREPRRRGGAPDGT